MVIEKRTLNWLPRASAYDEMQARQDKRKSAANEFISSQQSFASAFADLQSTATTSAGDLVAQAATARLNLKV